MGQPTVEPRRRSSGSGRKERTIVIVAGDSQKEQTGGIIRMFHSRTQLLDKQWKNKSQQVKEDKREEWEKRVTESDIGINLKFYPISGLSSGCLLYSMDIYMEIKLW